MRDALEKQEKRKQVDIVRAEKKAEEEAEAKLDVSDSKFTSFLLVCSVRFAIVTELGTATFIPRRARGFWSCKARSCQLCGCILFHQSLLVLF